jgi:hypothetical protein
MDGGIMSREERLLAPEIQILLNILDEPFKVEYPLYDFTLFTARMQGEGYRLGLCSDGGDFGRNLTQFNDMAREMPNYHDLLECLLHSGVVHHRNFSFFRERVEQVYGKLKKDIQYCPDTNLLYHGLPSQSGIEAKDFLLLDIVLSEIENHINWKYSPQEIEGMKNNAPYAKELLDELTNRKKRRSRTAVYFALQEYKRLREQARELPSVAPWSQDAEENDRTIVRTLKDYEGKGYAFPILLTADGNMAQLADAQGLEHMLLEMPEISGPLNCSAAAFVRCLFDLATVFGFIKINSVILYGEFGGKGSNLQELKGIFLNENAQDAFKRDAGICRKLLELEIE